MYRFAVYINSGGGADDCLRNRFDFHGDFNFINVLWEFAPSDACLSR
jgi:hypothetical protein